MDELIKKELQRRIPSEHLDHRLRREEHHQALQFKGGFKVYWENATIMSNCLYALLRSTGLLKRGIKNSLEYEVVHNTVKIERLPADFRNYTILQLSDLHIDGMFDHGKKLIRCLKGLHYDLCVLTGDFRFLTYGQAREAVLYTRKLFDSLPNRAHVLGILGNHDSIEMVPPLESLGIKMLINESTIIRRGNAQLGVAGTDDSHFYEAADIEKAHKQVRDCPAKVILAHSQETIEEASRLGFDLYLCGHTHGGQVCLPGKIPVIQNTPYKYRKKYSSGAWEHGRMKGYTSRGAGASGLAVRFNCPPEITLHKLI